MSGRSDKICLCPREGRDREVEVWREKKKQIHLKNRKRQKVKSGWHVEERKEDEIECLM